MKTFAIVMLVLSMVLLYAVAYAQDYDYCCDDYSNRRSYQSDLDYHRYEHRMESTMPRPEREPSFNELMMMGPDYIDYETNRFYDGGDAIWMQRTRKRSDWE